MWYSSMPWKSFSFRCTVTCLLSSCRFLSLWAKAWAAEQGRGTEHELRGLQAQARGPGILGGQGSGRGLGPRVLGSLGSHTPYIVCPAAWVARVTRGPEHGAPDPLRRGAGKHPEWQRAGCGPERTWEGCRCRMYNHSAGGLLLPASPSDEKGGGEAGRRKE